MTTEQVLTFDCAGEPLVGIVSLPAPDVPTRAVGVVIVVGGPQYRVGSHRQFVLLARRLAAAGHVILRFDCRGMGDSGGQARTFDAIDDDVAAAVAALRLRAPGLSGVALWGLCDGASASLLYLDAHPKAAVLGLCLVNPWVRSEASLARTRVKHYYAQRLLQRDFWRKLFRGDLTGAAWRGLLGNLKLAGSAAAGPSGSYQGRMARACERFNGPVLLLLSEVDYTAKEFLDVAASDPTWSRVLAKPALHRHALAGADHTFASTPLQHRVEQLTIDWLHAVETLAAPPGTARSDSTAAADAKAA